jgi:hypothetical protein
MMVALTLLATAVLNAIGAGLVTVTNTEASIAANYRLASELSYAAEAGANVAISDLARVSSWTTVLSGAVRSPFCDSTLQPATAFGDRLDLSALTSAFQSASDADARRGANNPRWRLYLYQPLSVIARTSLASSYVVVWVADDAAEADGDPQSDSNGLLAMRAEAFGPQGMQRTIDATLANDAAGVKLVSWRDVR